mmetsp:Transcript_51915/g.151205  ORF Transcript_51915/g.151205 Transcript_51915/m.151205 type:complete len:219 (-) Transcript_51915:1397-2053(-)
MQGGHKGMCSVGLLVPTLQVLHRMSEGGELASARVCNHGRGPNVVVCSVFMHHGRRLFPHCCHSSVKSGLERSGFRLRCDCLLLRLRNFLMQRFKFHVFIALFECVSWYCRHGRLFTGCAHNQTCWSPKIVVQGVHKHRLAMLSPTFALDIATMSCLAAEVVVDAAKQCVQDFRPPRAPEFLQTKRGDLRKVSAVLLEGSVDRVFDGNICSLLECPHL